jgi:hypothetical protein
VNPNLRKVALISASLGLLLSLYIVLKPGDDDEAVETTTAVTTTAPATTETEPSATTTAPTPEPSDVVTITITVPGDTAPTVRRFSVQQGRKVKLVVRSQLADEVHFHGYDLSADVAPGQPATIDFTANAPGRFEIELEERGLKIAELEVRP